MFSVAVPDYVTVNYDFTIWTSYTDQMNAIVETINWSEGSYWGEPGKFRFRASIDSFDDQSEYEDNRRNIKTTFSVTIKGYLIPDSFNDVVTTQKFITPKQLVVTNETDVPSRRFKTTQPPIYETKREQERRRQKEMEARAAKEMEEKNKGKVPNSSASLSITNTTTSKSLPKNSTAIYNKNKSAGTPVRLKTGNGKLNNNQSMFLKKSSFLSLVTLPSCGTKTE